MEHLALHPTTHALAIAAVVMAGVLAAGCERRPRDPKPPSDPGHNVPKPITGAALPAGPAAQALPRGR